MSGRISIAFSIVILLLSLIACVRDCTYSYFVKNNSTGIIKLKVEAYGDNGFVSEQFTIPANSEQLIFVDEGWYSGSENKPPDTLREFTLFEAVKNDSIQTVSNFKLGNKWSYLVTSTKSDSRAAKYTAEITDNDF